MIFDGEPWHSAGCETRDDRWPYSVTYAAMMSRRTGMGLTAQEQRRCHDYAAAIEVLIGEAIRGNKATG